MKTEPYSSVVQNTRPVSIIPSAPTQLAQVLDLATAAFETQHKTSQEFAALMQSLHLLRANGVIGRQKIIATLDSLGAQSGKVAESVNVNSTLSRRLDSAFDLQLAELTRLTERIEAMERTLRQPWLFRSLLMIRTSWHQMSHDARLTSANDWEAFHRAGLAGARFYRTLWHLTALAFLVVVLLSQILPWI